MRIIWFTHSLVSCWNHGNAHFLRGVLRELQALGHEVVALEPAEGWSRANLLREAGPAALAAFAADFPSLTPRFYAPDAEPAALVDGADLVVVHEWTDPALVGAIGRRRAEGAGFRLLFHDTHHRAVTAPEEMRRLDLSAYDGVLAFGATLAEVYRRRGWGERVFVWHEAADTALFHPPARPAPRRGVVWIGNWGDDERSAELREFLISPIARLGALAQPALVHGVRYPPAALALLGEAGITYGGWIANARVPAVFARHRATVHVPRRAYATDLPGIPTIRMFEALACGIPLVSAPWTDSEGLFSPGEDYLVARNGTEMARHLRALLADDALAAAVGARGHATIAARHSCAHRARALLDIAATLRHEVAA